MTLPTESMRQKLKELEAQIVNELPEVDCPVRHYFAEGLYAREMFIPKGVVVTGKIHKHEHISIMSAGKLRIVTDDEPITIEAPYTCVSPPGTKRAAYALEDTVWTTFHVTEETDLDKIEEHFIAKDFEELEKYLEVQKCLGVQ